MKDDHRGSGGRVGGFAHQQQLLCSGEGGRERRQLLEGNVGWQGRVQRQHGGHDAVGEQAFRLGAKTMRKTQQTVSLRWPSTGLNCTFKPFSQLGRKEVGGGGAVKQTLWWLT